MRPPDGRCTMCRDHLDKDAYCERCQVSFAPTPEEWTVTFCPECGWEAAVDEDGLCQTCGCIAVGRAVEEMATWRNYSLRTPSPEEPVGWQDCDCENPDGEGVAHVSESCPVHNLYPEPPIGQPLDGEGEA